MIIHCLECNFPLETGKFEHVSVVDCSNCSTKFIQVENTALTYVDEVPVEEFIGG